MATAVPINRPRYSPQEYLERPLPQNLEAERSILGGILLDNSCLGKITHIDTDKVLDPTGSPYNTVVNELNGDLRPNHFFLPQHRYIFEHMLAIAQKAQPIDTITLVEHLQGTGQLEAAGGVSYLSTLADGLPKGTNIAHYARIVIDKYLLRDAIYNASALQESALRPDAVFEDISINADRLAEYLRKGAQRSDHLTTVDANDFLNMTLPELEYVIQPLLTVRGRGMAFSPRGLGKTFVMLGMGHCIATGSDAFVWRVARARRVVYIDGEMHAAQLQQRVDQIYKIYGRRPEAGYLRLITRDLQKNARPKINTAEGRRQIESHLQPGCVLILDNLSALAPSGDEAETDEWAEIEDWLINLSWMGVSTIFIHHAGKSGQQRGTSKREDLLDFVLELRRPSNHSVEEGLRVEAHLTKVRGQIPDAKWGAPFEIVLRENEWLTRPLKGVLRDRAKLMLDSGMKPAEVAQETGLSRYQVYRIQKAMKDGTSELIDL